jgi:hypothetical protein
MIYEEWLIVKEFEEPITGFPYTIKARVLQLKSRNPNKIYYGSVSHFCKQDEQSTISLRPQAEGKNVAAIERELNTYIKSFTSIGVEENDDFDRLKY